MFVLQNMPAGTLETGNLKLEVLEIDSKVAKFDLTLAMVEDGEQNLSSVFIYNTDLFEEATITRLISHFEMLLNSIVKDPRQRISEIEMLTESERRQLLVEFNDTSIAYPQDVCLHQLFERQVERTPGLIALTFKDESLTYAELNGRANQLAHYLLAQGVGLEDRVGLLLERSVEMVVSLLAILKAGAAYVPLDPAYPTDRLSFILADSEASLLLSHSSLAQSLRPADAPAGSSSKHLPLLPLDLSRSEIAAHSCHNLDSYVLPDNLAYLIYTSGSTGAPKGVAIRHSSAAALMHWSASLYSPSALSGVLASTSVCFDLSVWELFAPLSLGGRVLLAHNALELPTMAARDEVSLINTVPSAMAELVRGGVVPQNVEVINLAGEPLSERLVREIFEGTAVKTVYDLYGPTEDTTYSTMMKVEAGERVMIGRPVGNTQVYILDEYLKPAGIGIKGELFIGGDGLAREYWNRPEMTAEKFIPNPFSARGGERLYRTGDIGRFRADGNIEFAGRADHQVKIRGFRIELGEIETVLERHPYIKEAVVVAQDTAVGQKRLVGYVVAGDGEELRAGEMRRHLGEKLPEHMIPSVFMQLAELPLTPNGKINRGALPAPDDSRPQLDCCFVAPTNPLEEELATIWRTLLGIERIGIHDNFFELGGHSLTATQLMSRVRARFDLEITLKDVFRAPTLKSFGELLEETFLTESGFKSLEEALTQSEYEEADAVSGVKGF
jgi:amino acid adenylation domain-containing protein